MSSPPALRIQSLSHAYGKHPALCDLSLEVPAGEFFALLGPNGSGKTTLFRILSTLIAPQSGTIKVFGDDLRNSPSAVRSHLGIVFQAPSVDKKLTVLENLRHRGRLYGLGGAELRSRCDALLTQLGLADRARDLVEKLSGGLRRRVELAGGMLHRPRLLLLDEPSTGLDPGARIDLWKYVSQVRQEEGITVVLTTHMLEEAEHAHRIGILDQGQLVALDTPDQLRGSVGGDTITIRCKEPESLAKMIQEKLECTAMVVGGRVRLEQPNGQQWVSRVMDEFGPSIESITLGKPTLEDVFIARTGHQFWSNTEAE